MIQAILHQIWNQRRSNGWLFAELLIVFTLLWYCIDILYGFTYAEQQPKGYDLEHVYKVRVSYNPTQLQLYSSEDSLQQFWFKPMEEIFRRIKQYPGVEDVAIWLGTDAYTRIHQFQGYSVDSVHVVSANIRYVSPEYFKVMRIPIKEGNEISVSEWNSTVSPQLAVITRDLADSLFHVESGIVGQEFLDFYSGNLRYRVSAVSALQKSDDYARYEPFIITPLPNWFYKEQYIPSISMRVRPESDTDDFATRFYRDMTPQLQIAPFFLFEVSSYKEQKIERDAAEGVTPYIRGARLVVIFFVFNVFIGLMGIFWFRTRHRRSEIALRMAAGSSRARVRAQLYGEGLMLLTIAAIPAIIICLNIVVADVTFTEPADATWLRFVACICITFCLMALMVIAGIWYPARMAMKVQPAEALHDD